MGEDIGALGGVFRVTDGLQKDFGGDRVVDTPLAESGIVGTAIGLALRGYRPVCEIQFDGFIFPAFDQITTQLAKMHYRSQGPPEPPRRHPRALRRRHRRGRAPQRVARGAVRAHRRSAGGQPVEPRRGVHDDPAGHRVAGPGAVLRAQGPLLGEGRRRPRRRARAPRTPASTPRKVLRQGTDVTLVAYGPTVQTALKAAEVAAAEGTSIEVVDLRALSPLDTATVAASVQQDRPLRRRARGARALRHRRRGRRADHRGVLLPPAGARAAGRRASTPRTRWPRSSTTTCPGWTACSTPWTARSPSDFATEETRPCRRTSSSRSPTRVRA